MEDKFVVVKKEVKDQGLTSDVIVKVLEIIEFANDNDVELYVLGGKLRMKSTILPPPDNDSDNSILGSGLDDLFGLFKKKK